GRGNKLTGIAIVATLGARIGTIIQGFPEGNTIVGNGGDGVDAGATSASATLELNQIGVSGFSANGNGGDGIALPGPSHPTGAIGPGTPIGANQGNGIHLPGASADADQVVANLIGVDPSDNLVGNQGAGVLIDGQGDNIIGGTAAGTGNTISG